MARIVTKQHALDIVRKLGAKLVLQKKQRPHDLYAVYEDGLLIAKFGVRRGSNKEQGHDHIPSQLYVGPKDARDLAQCPLSREEWIQKLREKNLI